MSADQQQQQQQLYMLLQTAVSASPGRAEAEQRLQSVFSEPRGVLLPLVAVVTQSEAAVASDQAVQLGLVLLRQYVSRRWERRDGGPPLPKEEKNAVRAALLRVMSVSALAASVAAEVASADLPDAWPGFAEHVVRTGDLRALEMLAEHVSDEQLPHLLPAVLPMLLRAAAAGQPMAFRCFAALMHTLHSFSSVKLRKRVVQRHFRPALPEILRAAGAAATDGGASLALRLEAVRVAEAAFAHLPNDFVRHAGAFLPQIYRMLIGMWPVYRDGALLADSEERAYDASGSEVSLSAVVSDALDLVTRILDAGLGDQLVRAAAGPLAAAAVLYAQLAEEQARDGREDPNEFAANEDDENQNVSPRMAASRLMHAMLSELGPEAAEHLGAHAAARLKAATWRDHEVAMFAAGHIAGAFGESPPASLPYAELLRGAVCPTLAADPSANDPLVVARAVWLVPRLAASAPPDAAREAFAGLARAIEPGRPLPGRIAAAQAAGRAAMDDEGAGGRLLNEVLRPVLSGAAELLSHAHGETLRTVLENFVELLQADEDTTIAACADATELVLKCWSANTGDPFVAADVARAVEVMARVPACLTPLQQRLAPMLSGLLETGPPQVPDAVTDVALMTLHALLEGCRRAGVAPHALLTARALPAAAATLARTDSDDVMDEATRVMGSFVRLAPGAVPGDVVLRATMRLLDPATPARGGSRAGELAWCLVRAAGELPPDLLRAAVARMRTTDYRPQAVRLLVFFARVLSGPGCEAVQARLEAAGLTGELALAIADVVGDVHGDYQTNVVFAFVMRLLEVRGPLANAPVQGPPVVDVNAGRSSRSRGKLATRPGPAEPLSACLLRALARVWANLEADRRDGPVIDDAFLRGVVAGMTGGSLDSVGGAGADDFGGGDDDDEDEDDDDDYDDDEDGEEGFELLSDRLDQDGLFVADENDDDDDRESDPLSKLDLVQAAPAFVRAHAQALAQDAGRLAGEDRETLDKMLKHQ